jgi:hypothetical protein
VSEGNGYTATQKSMLRILSDGLPHSREELHEVCGPSLVGVVAYHVMEIRKKLASKGETIVALRIHRQAHYQQVRLLSDAYQRLVESANDND